MVQRVLAYGILLAGILYAIAILKISYDKREEVKSAPGNFKVLAFFETLIFFLASVSLPDYVMQTILGKQMGIVEDRQLPGTVVGCGVVPGSILSFLLLIKGNPVDTTTVLLCSAAIIMGSIMGGFFLSKLDGDKIRKIMQIALVLSLVFLLIKMAVSSGKPASEIGLSGTKLVVVTFLCFLTGIINMFGVPMKPTRTAIFLIAGLSPLATLTMVLVVGSLSPVAGGVAVLRKSLYQKKMVLASTIFGSLGAIIGCLVVISIPELLLNTLLISAMVLAIIVMFRKKD